MPFSRIILAFLSILSVTAHAATVSVDTANFGVGSATNTNQLTFNHTLNANSNRIVVVGVQVEDGTTGDSTVTGVTYGGNTMTSVGVSAISPAGATGNTFHNRAYLFCILETNLPPNGNRNVVITTTNTCNVIIAGAMTLYDASQAAPAVTGTNSVTSAANISTTVNVGSSGSVLVDSTASGDPGIFNNPPATQTQRYNLQAGGGGGSAGAGSTRIAASTGNTTITQNRPASTNRLAQVVGVFEPSTSSGSCTATVDSTSIGSGTTGNTNVLTFNHTVGTQSNRILVVSVEVEDATTADTVVQSVTYGGAGLTQAVSQVTTGFASRSALWYLVNPPSGTAQVQITMAGTCNDITGGAVNLFDAAQQGPTATNSSFNANNPGSISTTVNVATAGSVLIDGCASGNNNAFDGLGAGQTRRFDIAANSSRGTASTLVSAVTGNVTMTQVEVTNRLAHTVAVFAPAACGVTIVWDGGGADTNWDNPLNWSTDTVPTSSDIALFNGTSTKGALINLDVNVAGIQIATGYTGTITQGNGFTVTVGSSGFQQNAAGSTVTGSPSSISVAGDFSLQEGTFNSTSGILSVGGDLTVGGGILSGTGGPISVMNDWVQSGGAVSAGAGNLSIQGDLAVSGGTLAGGGGNVNVAGTFSQSAGSVALGSSDIVIGGDLNVAGTFSSASGDIGVGGTLALNSGTFAGGSGAMAVSGSVALTGGTFTSTSGTLELAGDWTVTGATFDHNSGRVLFNGTGADQTITGSGLAFYDLEVDSGGAGDNVSVTGDLTLAQNLILTSGEFDIPNVTVTVLGNVVNSTPNTLDSYLDFTANGTIRVAGNMDIDSYSQNLEVNPQGQSTIEMNGTVDQTFHIRHPSTLSTFHDVDNFHVSNTAGKVTVINNNNDNFEVDGTLTIDAGAWLEVEDDVLLNGNTVVNGMLLAGGTFNTMTVGPSGTLSPGDPNAPPFSVGQLSGNNLTFQSGSSLTVHVEATSLSPGTFDAISLNGTLTIQNGWNINLDGAALGGAPLTGTIDVVTFNSRTGTDPGTLAGVTSGSASTSFTAAALRITFNAAVLPVTVDLFHAYAAWHGAVIEWRVASEFQNAGFHVWRRPFGAPVNAWQRVTDAMVAGRITNPSPKTYRLFDLPEPDFYEYALEDVSIYGVRTFRMLGNGPVAVGVDELRWSEVDACLFGNEVAEAWGRSIEQELLLQRFVACERLAREPMPPRVAASRKTTTVHADAPGPVQATGSAKGARSPAPAGARTSATQFGASEQGTPTGASTRGKKSQNTMQVAKVVHEGSGVLLVPKDAMPSGFDVIHATVLRESEALKALASTDDGLLLYAPGYRDNYTDKDVFFLQPKKGKTAAGKLKVLKSTALFKPSISVVDHDTVRVVTRFEDLYFNFATKPLDYEPWISSKLLTADDKTGSVQSFALQLPNLTEGSASLEVTLYGFSSFGGGLGVDHAVQVFVNGQFVGSQAWDHDEGIVTLRFDGLEGILQEGANSVDLLTPPLAGIGNQLAYVYGIAATYVRSFTGPGPVSLATDETDPRATIFELSGFDTGTLWVVDARVPEKAVLLPYGVRDDGGSYTVRIKVKRKKGDQGNGILVVPQGMELLPLSITARSIERPAAHTAYLAVGPSAFDDPIQPLLNFHQSQGLDAQFIDQEDLFDYYNFGRYGPAGIRNAVRDLRPKYLLLCGRSIWDYLDREGLSLDPLCPTFMAPTTNFSEAPCDALFSDLGNGIPELAVGRFPVNTPEELATAVARTLGYAGGGASSQKGFLAADAVDSNATNFHQLGDQLAAAVPDIAWEKAYRGTSEFPSGASVNAAMTAAANGAADLVVYIGHGSSSRLNASILDVSLASAWTGNVVLLSDTCTMNYFIHNLPGLYTIPENLLAQPQGGISASIATTTYLGGGLGAQFVQQVLMEAQVSGTTWGEALLSAQQWALQKADVDLPRGNLFRDMAKTESLLGDPALKVRPWD